MVKLGKRNESDLYYSCTISTVRRLLAVTIIFLHYQHSKFKVGYWQLQTKDLNNIYLLTKSRNKKKHHENQDVDPMDRKMELCNAWCL